MTRKIFGLDIRTHTLSAVLLTSGLKGNAMEFFAHVGYGGDGEDAPGFSTALQQIIEQTDITDAVCMVSLPAEAVSFRNLKVPFRDQKKISQILPLELEPLLPYSTDDVLMDFQTMSSSDNTEFTDIIAATLKKSYLEHLLAELSACGITPRIIVPGSSQAILCLNHFSDIPDQSILVDIGHDQATIAVVVAGQIRLMRTVGLHSQQQKKVGHLCADVQRTVAASETLAGLDIRPGAFFLTGPGMDDADYAAEFGVVFDVSVQQMDLTGVAGVEMDGVKAGSWTPHLMDNALSLALTDITGMLWMNFSQRRFTVKKQWVEHKKNIVKSAVLLGFILLLALFNAIFDYYQASQEMDRLDQEISRMFKASFPEVTRIVDPLHQMKVKVNELKEQAALSEGAEGTIFAIDILNDISKMIPESLKVELERLVIGPDNVTISGETAGFDTVDDMKGRLEKGKLFEKVVISSANTDRSGDKVKFKLKIILKKEGETGGTA